MGQAIEWATVSPGFGSAMPHGSCAAIVDAGPVCGYPLREDGSCLKGHPARPEDAS